MDYYVAIIGYLGSLSPSVDGQTVKTQQLSQSLKHELGESLVYNVEMQLIKKNPFAFLLKFLIACRCSKNVIILPAYNALRVFPILCLILKKKNTHLFYDVIGGWLPAFLEKHVIVKNLIKKFDGVWVETSLMKKKLNSQGVNNVTVVHNFKDFELFRYNQINTDLKWPIRLCIFSRINNIKGIDDGINAVIDVNSQSNKILYSLDLYGSVDSSYSEHFSQIIRDAPEYIKFCGCVPSSEAQKVLSNYSALLFPTRYEGEGQPGAIIDAYSVGIPVISAKWHSYDDFIDVEKTGFCFMQFNYKELVDTLLYISEDPSKLHLMRNNCFAKAEMYMSKVVIKQILFLMLNEGKA